LTEPQQSSASPDPGEPRSRWPSPAASGLSADGAGPTSTATTRSGSPSGDSWSALGDSGFLYPPPPRSSPWADPIQLSPQASFATFDLSYATGGDLPPASTSLLQTPDMFWYPESCDGQGGLPAGADATAWGPWGADYSTSLPYDSVSGAAVSASLYDTTMGSY